MCARAFKTRVANDDAAFVESSEIPHGLSSRWSRALRSVVAASLVTGAALLQPVADPAMAATDSDLCFIVADRGGSNGGDDRLVTFTV